MSPSLIHGPTYNKFTPIPRLRDASGDNSHRKPAARRMNLISAHANATLPKTQAPRQIRFVATDGQPHTKRRRINAACLTCRKRKTRCSGERPECKTCTENGHLCSGYTGRSSRKENDREEDGEDEADADSPPSTPRKHHKDAIESTAPFRPAMESSIRPGFTLQDHRPTETTWETPEAPQAITPRAA